MVEEHSVRDSEPIQKLQRGCMNDDETVEKFFTDSIDVA